MFTGAAARLTYRASILANAHDRVQDPELKAWLRFAKYLFLFDTADSNSVLADTLMKACNTNDFAAAQAELALVRAGRNYHALTNRAYKPAEISQAETIAGLPRLDTAPPAPAVWPKKKKPAIGCGFWPCLLKCALCLLAIAATGTLLMRVGAEGMETLASAAEGARRWLSSPGGGQCATTQRIDEKLAELESKHDVFMRLEDRQSKEIAQQSREQNEANAALVNAAIAQAKADAAKERERQAEEHRRALEAQAEAFERAEQERLQEFERAQQEQRDEFKRAKQEQEEKYMQGEKKRLQELEKAKDAVTLATGAAKKVMTQAATTAVELKADVQDTQKQLGALQGGMQDLKADMRAAKGQLSELIAQAKVLETTVHGLQSLVLVMMDELQLFFKPDGELTFLSFLVVVYALVVIVWLVVDISRRFWARYAAKTSAEVAVAKQKLAETGRELCVLDLIPTFLMVLVDLGKLVLFFAGALILLQIAYWAYQLAHATMVTPIQMSAEKARAVGQAVNETLEAVGETLEDAKEMLVQAKDFTGATLNETKHNLERIGNASRKLLGF
jgi:hypothetical protein